jgi:type VI protein secretion system component VasF
MDDAKAARFRCATEPRKSEAQARLKPVQNNVGWWLVAAFAVLLVVVAIVTHNG